MSLCHIIALFLYVVVGSSCPAGQFYLAANRGCVAVPAGFYQPRPFPSAMIFYICPIGFYTDTIGASACLPCPVGYSSNPGDTVCTGPCAAGTYISQGTCTPVPAGRCV